LDNKIEKIIEVKTSDQDISKSLIYFHNKYQYPAVQLVKNLHNEYQHKNIQVLNLEKFLAGLDV